jgi:amino acid transporter
VAVASEMTPRTTELRSSSIGVTDVLFQAITYMAPGVGLAFSIGIAVPISGTTLPLSVIVALIACTFAAVSIGQMANRIPSAGGLYTYAAKGLGPRSGFMVGWFYLGFALLLPSALALLGGWLMNLFLSAETGLDFPWWFWGALLMLAILGLTYFDVQFSARATIVLGVIEITVLMALALTMIVANGDSNSVDPFTPSMGAGGWSGIFQGAVFAILAFIGFEAASALGEEARNPKRTIQIGVIGSCILVGLFYVFQTYAWNVGAEMDIVGHNVETQNSDWTAFGDEFWGKPGAWILFVALVNSVIACGAASTNNAARVLFSMGRSGNAPAALGKVHPKYKSPYIAVMVIVFVGYALDLIIAAIFGGGLEGFIYSATFFTVLAILIYIISCAACIGYFSKAEGKPYLKPLLHYLVPAIGILAFVLPLYTQYFNLGTLFADGSLFQWAYKDEAGGNVFFSRALIGASAVLSALLFTILGLAVAFALGAARPQALMAAAQMFGGEGSDETKAEAASITH